MKVLELFSGTGSVGTYCKNNDIDVVSVDWDKKFDPTFCCDIMSFDYKQYSVGHFDIVWASPECKIYSILQYSWIGRKWKNKEEIEIERKKHDKFILKTIEIIEYLKPKFYFIENPRYSKIWDVVPYKYINDFVCIDYCRFSDWGYKKPTKILTNKKLKNVLCNCKKNKHSLRIGGTDCGWYGPNLRYRVPQLLIKYLLE